MLGDTTPTGTDDFFLTGDWNRINSNLSPALTGETDLLLMVFFGVVRMAVDIVTVLLVGVNLNSSSSTSIVSANVMGKGKGKGKG